MSKNPDKLLLAILLLIPFGKAAPHIVKELPAAKILVAGPDG